MKTHTLHDGTLIVTNTTAEQRLAIDAIAKDAPQQIQLISVKETALILDCSPRTVRRLTEAGKLKSIMISDRKTRFDKIEVMQFARTGSQEAI